MCVEDEMKEVWNDLTHVVKLLLVTALPDLWMKIAILENYLVKLLREQEDYTFTEGMLKQWAYFEKCLQVKFPNKRFLLKLERFKNRQTQC